MKIQNCPVARRICVAAVSLLLAGNASAQTTATATANVDPYVGARTEFRTAYALASAALPAPGDDSASLQAYPLYPYLQAMRLQRLLRPGTTVEGLDTEVATFFAANGDALAGHDLRRAWLLNLADRSAWDAYLANYLDTTTDATLRCDALSARVALGRTASLAAAISEQWLVADKSPSACDAAFAWLRSQPQWNAALVEKRARLVLAAGNASYARSIITMLPPAAAAPLLEWATLIENPKGEVDALIAQPQRPAERAAILDGWTRLSRKDPDGAASRYPALVAARGLTAVTASPFARATALGLAWSRKPAALDYFSRTRPADLDTIAYEWWARSALWADDWALTAKVIAGMPEALRTQQRWRYWSLRAAANGGDAGADTALSSLADEDGWYPALAAAQLHQPYAPHPQPIPLDGAAQLQIANLPGIVRAHELFLVALRPLASAEWTQATEALDAESRTQGIGLAMRWGWYDQGVATASRQAVFTDYELLYPRPYDDAVNQGAQVSGLSGDLIYAIIRQESLYRADAVSKANALGLMQLIRETAGRTARRIGRAAPTGDALFDPSVNVPIGSAHLGELVERFSGQVPLAIAGYNAGPNAVPRWLAPDPLALDVWVENIPYNETRTYVQRVMWHALVFGWRRTGKPQKLDSWLVPVSLTPAAAVPSAEPDVSVPAVSTSP